MELENILIEPVVTEKTNAMREEESVKYVFRVLPAANKHQVSEAVEKIFNVKPVACNVMWVKGKKKQPGLNQVTEKDRSLLGKKLL